MRAEELATVRYETDPGRQMQIDFGEKRVLIGGVWVKVHLLVAVLGYSRRIFVDTEGDAKEAGAVAERLMRKLATADSEHSDCIVSRQGDKLALVFGAPKGSAEKVTTELLKEWRVER